MILLLVASSLLTFGGATFGESEESARQKIKKPQTEEVLAEGSRAISVVEQIAGHEAKRKWVIRNGAFVEGILTFDFKGSSDQCRQLQITALTSLESNYGVAPRLDMKKDSGPSGFQSELWVVSLSKGARIEQRMIYVPLIKACTVGGLYFPPAEGASQF